ncbi:SecY-interacting protein [Aliidiomarina iranensis]|uniref:Protein Syd n=1 Tax=Aliidiomarina iranensis TaxID=1434071 RepID=A0A432W0P0_9GAMM|nr:SecY-interacting protein [Aliidiomarina iranensis]RUO22552.1 SecY-interacting protein [Aliidiomarina iranensis]
MNSVIEGLNSLHERYAKHYEEAGLTPKTEYISNWDAPCYVGKPSGGDIAWRAVPQTEPLDFSGVEHALEMQLDDQVKVFFSCVYAGDLALEFKGNSLELLQVMHPEDGERLQQNLIGHVMMKQRLQQTITLFLGVTDEDDLLISVNNETGAVGLEYVGKDQHEILADDLASFLTMLAPRLPADEFEA